MLYHVSFTAIPGNRFHPRIPTKRAPEEDAKIKRICFAPTIEKCLTAMPLGGQAINNLIYLSEIFLVSAVLHIYSIEKDRLPAENVWGPEITKNFVADASYTGETWVVNQEVVCDHEIIEVKKAEILSGIDKFGQKMYEVNSLEWERLDTLPDNAPEKSFAETGEKTIDFRTMLAYMDRALVEQTLARYKNPIT